MRHSTPLLFIGALALLACASTARTAESSEGDCLSKIPVDIPDDAIWPIKRVAPNYPRSAVRDGIEGDVTLEATIDKHGRPVDIEIVDADPPGVFDTAALDSARQWRYCPPSAETSYPDRFKVKMRFRLP